MSSVVDAWNAANPIGTPVVFWPAFKDEPGRESVTRSAAWVMPSGTAVVLVEGYTGGIALTHVDPVKRAISGADIKPGMTILLTPGSKPFRVDGVEPFNKLPNTFTLASEAPDSEATAFVSADRWYCLLGGGT